MKWLTILFLLTFSKPHAHAQDSWTVTHNGKPVITATVEDTAANRITISKAALHKWGRLRLTYNEVPERKDWNRTLVLFNTTQKELLQKKGATLKIRNRRLRVLLKNAQSLSIHTFAIPADPAVAATVRVRSVHLCTLSLPQ